MTFNLSDDRYLRETLTQVPHIGPAEKTCPGAQEGQLVGSQELVEQWSPYSPGYENKSF